PHQLPEGGPAQQIPQRPQQAGVGAEEILQLAEQGAEGKAGGCLAGDQLRQMLAQLVIAETGGTGGLSDAPRTMEPIC
ncbi:MAG: hypothetical protein ACKOZT_04435, partial [Cyanobium sp.]